MAQRKRICLPMQETEEMGSIAGSGRALGGRNVNPLQYSCLGNSDRGAWRATVHGWTSTHAAPKARLFCFNKFTLSSHILETFAIFCSRTLSRPHDYYPLCRMLTWYISPALYLIYCYHISECGEGGWTQEAADRLCGLQSAEQSQRTLARKKQQGQMEGIG